MLRNVPKLFSVTALPRIISKRPASIPSTRKTLMTLANAGALCFTNKGGVDDFDGELQRVGEAGRRALKDRLNTLKDKILSVSKQYQKCLDEQMAITREGADHVVNDTLKEVRMMSADLKVGLDNLLIAANMVGRMLQLEAMKDLTDNKDFVQLIQKRFKELENLLNQAAQNVKKLEENILDMQRKLKE